MSRPWYKVSFFAQYPEGVEPKTANMGDALAIAEQLADAFGFEIVDSPVLVRLGESRNLLEP